MSSVMIYQPVPCESAALQTILKGPDQAYIFASLFTCFSGPFITIDHVGCETIIECGIFSERLKTAKDIRNAYNAYSRNVKKLRKQNGIWHEKQILVAGVYQSVVGDYLYKNVAARRSFSTLIKILYGREIAITSNAPSYYSIRISNPLDIETLYISLCSVKDDIPALAISEQARFLRMCIGCIKRGYSYLCNEE